MNTILILQKDNFKILSIKNINEKSSELNDNNYTDIIELCKDLDQLNNISKPTEDCIIMKLESNKTVVFRKSKNINYSIIIICDKKAFKRPSLSIISKKLLDSIVNENDEITFNEEVFATQSIEELTLEFIEYLRNNKLFPKFIYLNYNPSAAGSISNKKVKTDSTSVILYTSSGKDSELNRIEQRDTILQKSTIKEKDLNLEQEKKPNQPIKKKIFIKKFNDIKSEKLLKPVYSKLLKENFFIEKYFLTTSHTMIHMLFNNIFIDNPNEGNSLKDNFNYPINPENEHALLFLLDLYDKGQQMLSINKQNTVEYLDIVNYIEFELTKPEILLIKNKMVFIKYKALFIGIQIEIYEDKNYWNTINNNTNYYKEIECLFQMLYNNMFK